jgi:NTE family protein
MSEVLAFSLGVGGARGAIQVGALRALLEAGLQPNLLVGTSIGAVNPAFLGIHGVSLDGLRELKRFYNDAAEADLMDTRLPRLAAQALAARPNILGSRRLAQYLVDKGVPSDLRFGQVTGARLALIGADLDTSDTVIYGRDPEERILDGLMASTALPPWFAPVKKERHVIMDGGAVSLVPIEPALRLGATEIIALALDDPKSFLTDNPDLYHFIDKLTFASPRREVRLEIALAEARGVHVRWMGLRCPRPTLVWDFSRSAELIEAGLLQARREIDRWGKSRRSTVDRSPANFETAHWVTPHRLPLFHPRGAEPEGRENVCSGSSGSARPNPVGDGRSADFRALTARHRGQFTLGLRPTLFQHKREVMVQEFDYEGTLEKAKSFPVFVAGCCEAAGLGCSPRGPSHRSRRRRGPARRFQPSCRRIVRLRSPRGAG